MGDEKKCAVPQPWSTRTCRLPNGHGGEHRAVLSRYSECGWSSQNGPVKLRPRAPYFASLNTGEPTPAVPVAPPEPEFANPPTADAIEAARQAGRDEFLAQLPAAPPVPERED